MSSQNGPPRQTTRLFFGAVLSSPQLEQAKASEPPEQSGQLVGLIAQKYFNVPLANRSATRLQRMATTSPRSWIVGVAFSQVGANSGATLNILTKRARVLGERFPRCRLLEALRSRAIATATRALMMLRAWAFVLPARR